MDKAGGVVIPKDLRHRPGLDAEGDFSLEFEELIALDDGHRESTEPWADLLRSCKRRGMSAPVLAVGDGALGFVAAALTQSLTDLSASLGPSSLC